jgi:hypothetical protein
MDISLFTLVIGRDLSCQPLAPHSLIQAYE